MNMKAKIILVAACVALLYPVVPMAAEPAAPAKVEPAKAAPVAAPAPAPAAGVDAAAPAGKERRKPRRTKRSQRESVAPAVSPHESECAWLGKRVSSLLKRDDIDAARQFETFYSAFGCPIEHLGKAFGCVVRSESPAEPIDARIDRCWDLPYTRNFPDADSADEKSGAGAEAGAPVGAPVGAPAKARAPASQDAPPRRTPAKPAETTGNR